MEIIGEERSSADEDPYNHHIQLSATPEWNPSIEDSKNFLSKIEL